MVDGECLYVFCIDICVCVYCMYIGIFDVEFKGYFDDVVACVYKDGGDVKFFICGKDVNVFVWVFVSVLVLLKYLGDIDGDVWSDDDDVDGVVDVYGCSFVVADFNRSRSASRGLGYCLIYIFCVC